MISRDHDVQGGSPGQTAGLGQLRIGEFYRRWDTLVKQMVGAFGLLGPVLFGVGAWIRRGGLM